MTTSSHRLPPTSILGRYQAQRGSLLPGAKGCLSVDTEYSGYAAVDSTDSRERRHTAEFIRNDDEILSRPSVSRHINTWLNLSNVMSGVDSSIDKLGDNGGTRLELPRSLIPSHDTAITPLHEDPILFRALPDSQRRYTQGLVSDDDGLLAPPKRKIIFRPSPKDLLLSSQSNYIDDTRSHLDLQSPHPIHWSSTRAHPFQKHPIPISSHNPFRNPQRRPNTHTLPVKQQPVLVPTRARQRNPWPLQSHIFAPSPKVPNPNMVKYLENLVDDDIDVILYMSFQRSRSRSVNPDIDHSPNLPDHGDEQDQNQNQGATHAGRNGYLPSSQSQPGVVDHDGLERFLGERRRLSPPEAGAGTDEEEPTSDKGIFDDFPVCEMSIAMGLHDGMLRGGA